MKRITISIFILCYSLFLNGQILKNPSLVNTVNIEKRVDNFIVVQITINGKELKMLVDTGATTSVLTKKADNKLYNQKRGKKKNISDGFQTIVTEEKKYTVQIGSLIFNKIEFHIIDEVKTNLLLGVDGIIGVNLLRNMPFKINTEAIIFSKKAKYLLPYPEIPALVLRKYRNVLKVHGKIGAEIASNGIIIDIGSNTLITVGEQMLFHKREQNAKKYKSTYGIGKSYENLLSSNDDFDTTELIQAPKFSFSHLRSKKKYNEIKYEDLVLPILNKNNSIFEFGIVIGNQILDYYDLVFDIKKGDFYPIQKDSTYNNPNYETFGLGIIPGDTSRIGIIWKDSPAYKAGLKSGLIVNSLNAIDLKRESGLSLKEKYDTIVQTLEIETEITLKYLDELGTEKTLVLKKKPLF